MKRLVSIISTKGKTSEQAAQEAFQAFQKFQQVNKRSIKQVQAEAKLKKAQPKD